MASGVCLVCLILIASFSPSVTAATTSLNIVRYAPDGMTRLNETTVEYTWMEQNLPLYGDGVTRYYLQGPVFLDDPDPATKENIRWNPGEDTNVREKDMGAVKGTNVRDLCDLVGGMFPGDILIIKAEDGFSREFSYRNVYEPSPRQGPMVIAWWNADSGYVPEYREGMRLLFFADTGNNPWGIHAMGNWDWHESADEQYWYYYRQGDERYPTTTGLSVQYVSTLRIMPANGGHVTRHSTAAPTPSPPVKEPFSLLTGILSLGICCFILDRRRDHP